MPKVSNWAFTEYVISNIHSQRISFSVDDHQFYMLFTPVLESGDDQSVLQRGKDIGFVIPPLSFDVKFDRVENFESDQYYQLPSNNFSMMDFSKMRRLGVAICQLLEFHTTVTGAQVYFASAASIELKHFYDRLVRQHAHRLNYTIYTGLGEEELDYAIKTPKYTI